MSGKDFEFAELPDDEPTTQRAPLGLTPGDGPAGTTGYEKVEDLMADLRDADTPEPVHDPDAPPPLEVKMEELVEMARFAPQLLKAMADKGCERYNVSPMGEDEARLIIDAAGTVATQYDIQPPKDPRKAAWTMFGLAVGSFFVTRLMEIVFSPDEEPETPPAAPAPTPVAPVQPTSVVDYQGAKTRATFTPNDPS